MFRFYPPGTNLFALAIAGILKLIPSRQRKHKPVAASRAATSRLKDSQPYISEIQRVVNQHSAYTAEVISLIVVGSDEAYYSSQLAPGDRVDLKLVDNHVSVYMKDKNVGNLLIPDNSRLPQILTDSIDFEAYLGGRDVLLSSWDIDYTSIIVFYKIDGVPPTRVELK